MNAVAFRAKQYRQRQKAGRCVLMVECDELELSEALQRKGWLTISDPDRDDISEALGRWIEKEIKCDQ